MKYILKVFFAGVTAFILLCLLTSGYFLIPLNEPNPLGNTDYISKPGGFFIQMLEGISWGRFDQWGFHNPKVVENPDIVLLGSSHMEATYVMQDELAGVQLEKLLNGRATVYNMGISGCHLPQTLQYLPKTLEAFEKTPGLLVIEAHDLQIDEEMAQQILTGTIPSIYQDRSPLKRKAMSFPYLYLLAEQKGLGLLDLLNPPRKPAEPAAEEWEEILPAEDPRGDVWDPVFAYMKDLKEKWNTELLIFYQPTEELQEDGSVLYHQDPWLDIFQKKCRENGIHFINLTDQFSEIFQQEHRMAHGFITGNIGGGHLNAEGQKAIAQGVYRWILQKEGN